MKITGLVLAGGKSSRMGQDKALLVRDGKTLLASAVNVLAACCDETVICSSDPRHSVKGLRRIPDRWPKAGPMAAIASAMESLPSSKLFLPIGVDQIGINPHILSYLIKAYQLNTEPLNFQPRFDALSFKADDRLQPLGAIYHRRILPSLRLKIKKGQLGLVRLFKKDNGYSSIPFDAIFPDYPSAFINLNSPQDLDQYT